MVYNSRIIISFWKLISAMSEISNKFIIIAILTNDFFFKLQA